MHGLETVNEPIVSDLTDQYNWVDEAYEAAVIQLIEAANENDIPSYHADTHYGEITYNAAEADKLKERFFLPTGTTVESIISSTIGSLAQEVAYNSVVRMYTFKKIRANTTFKPREMNAVLGSEGAGDALTAYMQYSGSGGVVTLSAAEENESDVG